MDKLDIMHNTIKNTYDLSDDYDRIIIEKTPDGECVIKVGRILEGGEEIVIFKHKNIEYFSLYFDVPDIPDGNLVEASIEKI